MHLPHALLGSIPAPPFRDIDLGPLTLHVYGLCLGLAIVLAINLCEWLLRREGVTNDRLLMGVMLPGVVAGFIGGRLYHVLSEPQRYADSPGDIVKVWEGGLGIWGAIGLGAVVALWRARRVGLPRAAFADAAAPAVVLAQALGRWGNYFNQELFGRPSDAAWALEVDPERRPERYAEATTFHPTYLYESLGAVAIGLVLIALYLRWGSRPRGVLFPLYVALYSTLRFFVEGLRIDPAHEFGPLRQNEWLALVLAVGGFAVAGWMVLRNRGRAAATPAT